MCTNYTPTRRNRWLEEQFGVSLPEQAWSPETWPGLLAPLVLVDRVHGVSRCVLARFGLIPAWARDATFGRHTYNARSETAASKPSFRQAWRERRYALATMDHFFEPRWDDAAHGGKSVRWRIARADGQPFAAASLWERWTDPASGEIVTSFSMLTVNADEHPLMNRFHRPGEEKRMLVIVPMAQYAEWLQASPATAARMMCPLPADELVAEPAPLPTRARAPARTTPIQADLLSSQRD